jgi:hypothetical protein
MCSKVKKVAIKWEWPLRGDLRYLISRVKLHPEPQAPLGPLPLQRTLKRPALQGRTPNLTINFLESET